MPEIDFAAILKEDAATIAPPADGLPPASAPADTAAPATAPGDDAPDPPEAEAPKPKRTVEERISTLTAKRKEAERRADKAEADRQELLDRLTRTTPTDDPFDPSKFTTLEERDKAVREQARKEALAEMQAEASKKQIDGFWADLDKQGKDIEDFEDVTEALHAKDFPISDVMAAYLVNEADHKAPLAKWFVDNRKEAERIFGLPAVAAVKELARRDSLLGRGRASPVTKAPPPPPSVEGASGSSPQSLEAMSHEDIKKWAKEQQR